MKVLLGWIDQEHGAVETAPAGLVYGGPDPEHVRELVERQRVWYDRAGVKHILTDEELVCSLPYRRQGWSWAVFVDEQGVTQDQPPYDPWGDIWKSQEGMRAVGKSGLTAEEFGDWHGIPLRERYEAVRQIKLRLLRARGILPLPRHRDDIGMPE